ncbi:MAG: DEAD/DEAH box helicase [Holophagales bacterium]|nr:DEAD/DEAH box helicase [Holophagales bacterium]
MADPGPQDLRPRAGGDEAARRPRGALRRAGTAGRGRRRAFGRARRPGLQVPSGPSAARASAAGRPGPGRSGSRDSGEASGRGRRAAGPPSRGRVAERGPLPWERGRFAGPAALDRPDLAAPEEARARGASRVPGGPRPAAAGARTAPRAEDRAGCRHEAQARGNPAVPADGRAETGDPGDRRRPPIRPPDGPPPPGDVGSGKTIVAVLTAVLAAGRGFQTALMAPTTILAEQHAETVFRLLAGSGVTPALLTARVTGRPRAALLAALAEGEIALLVGTHALIEKPVAFQRLGLVVVDEQHRFGVAQRAALPARVAPNGLHPHVLVLSATPIPRSLALALHGDLDVSTLTQKPPGRTPILTKVFGEEGREEAYRALAGELESGGRGYVVVPLVEDSETIDARAVASWTDEVARRLPGRRVGAVHGKMRAEAREKAMRQFAAGDLDVLVATTVVEVGIDVPEASFLLVENADRFGLAQLHQLRGRIGRGARPSTCVLLQGEGASAGALSRLSILVRTDDGFAVAEEDLRLRGPGEALGTRQSGLPEFRVADPFSDLDLLAKARELALRFEDEGATEPYEKALFLRSSRR